MRKIVMLALVMAGLISGSVLGDVILTPSLDGTVMGGTHAYSDFSSTTIMARFTPDQYYGAALLRFPITTGLGDMTSADVTSATLKLYVLDTIQYNVEQNITLSNISSPFTSDADYDTYDGTTAWKGSPAGTLYRDLQANEASRQWYTLTNGTQGMWIEFDVTAEVKYVLDTPNDNDGFAIYWKGNNGTGWHGTTTFASSADATYAPQLVVVPEPATMCLIGLGALSLIRRRR